MDRSLESHGTAPFGHQLEAALLRTLALEEEYKSACHPASNHLFHHPRDDIYSSRPGLSLKNGYVCALIDYAEGDMREFVDDDVDADSDCDDASDTFSHLDLDKDKKRCSITSKMMHTEDRGAAVNVPGTTTGAGTFLVPTDGEAQFSFRITRIPYDLPELLPDKETTSTVTSLTTSPPTPILVDDIFQPLSSLSVPDLKFHLSTPPRPQSATGGKASGPSMSPIQRKPKTVDSGKHVSSNHRFSFDGPDEIDVTKAGHSLTPSISTTRTLSSAHSTTALRTKTAGSSDEPPTFQAKWGAFSRIRNSVRSSRLMTADEDFGFLERRSLTPHLISPTTTTHPQTDNTASEGPATARPSTSSSISGAADTATIASSTVSTRDGGRGSLEKGWSFGFGRRKPKAMGDVFGVDLIKSIEIAPAKIRISHNGRSNSHRKFPLSVHKCCEFIKASGKKTNPMVRMVSWNVGTDGWLQTPRTPHCSLHQAMHFILLIYDASSPRHLTMARTLLLTAPTTPSTMPRG